MSIHLASCTCKDGTNVISDESGLAILGGSPWRARKEPVKFVASEGTHGTITAILRGESPLSDWYGGPEVRRFESMFARVFEAAGAVATNSGTSAIHTALCAAGIGIGHEVLVPSYCYFSAVSAVLQQGAVPILYDCNIDTSPIDDDQRIWNSVGVDTKAILVVHMYGVVQDTTELWKEAKKRGIKLIEDCSQALGARVSGHLIGTTCDYAAFSMSSPRHHIAVGEAGVLLVNSVHDVGIAREIVNKGKQNTWRGPIRQGFSYAMPEITAVLAQQALLSLESEVRARQEAANAYDEILAGTRLELCTDVQQVRSDQSPACYRKVVLVPPEYEPIRDWVVAAIEAERVSAKPPHPVVHRIPWLIDEIRRRQHAAGRTQAQHSPFAHADRLHRSLVDLETGPGLSVPAAVECAQAVKKVMQYLEDNLEAARRYAYDYGDYGSTSPA